MSRPSYDARTTRPTSSHLSREYSSADVYTLSKQNPSDAELRSLDRSPRPPAGPSRATASSATSTSTPRILTYQDADEEDDEDEGGWTTTYDDFVPRRASTMYQPGMGHIASSTSKTNVLEMVQQPILAPHDWSIGEKRTDWGKRGSSRGENPRAVPPFKAKVKRVKGFVGRHWKWLLAIVLALIVVVALILYFLLPRVPGVDFQGSNPIIKTSTFAQTSSSPAFFYFTSDLLVNILTWTGIIFAVDASASYIPIIFSMFQVQLSLQETGKVIAQGPRTGIKVNGKTSTIYQIPLTWSGNMSVSDPTFKAVRQACQTIYPTTTRPGLNLTMSVKTNLIGLIGTHHTHPVSIDNVPCPIQFPGNSS
ncbi:BZ3500_MvSof-1268-A1-R1_Chr1-1g01118 [Microbotryum saponariae]|uniref:BZ3500_MvSof-1268-A1-R1_Chr1-1g01118 protein n=1 Tax=Microbotryum saponariae TaxID=289078 RepID=A0A2X0KN93_9BASI|nr:BZ3500_MvSof-1268-A1-R1_Chr1-1g01118 [Microbotryum saponariae]SCZ93418.1 BZ3501_MvSof-1269-A2-R1_Chr1-1g00715 [Microbotryum saponariae]